MAAYTQQDYARDKQYIQRHDSVRSNGDLSKLDVLVLFNVTDKLYINHEGLSSKFLVTSTVQRLLQHNVVLDNMLKKRHRETKGSEMREEELKQTRGECLDKIRKRVEDLFERRYRGAVGRVERYERNLCDPKVQLKDLRAALNARDPDKVYELAERVSIMTEHLPDDHPLVKRYDSLQPSIKSVLKF